MQRAKAKWRLGGGASNWRAYVAAAAMVALCIAIGSVLRRLPQANLSLLFLLAVLIVAAVWGLWPSIFATVLSFLSLNFFFTTPRFTLTVEEEGDVASIVFFLAMAALTANLAARMRSEMAESRAALGRVSALLEFSGRMSSAVSVEDVLTALTATIARTLGREAAVRLTDEPGFAPAFDKATPLRIELTTRGDGAVAIGGAPLNTEERKLADGLCEQASLAVERILLVEDLKTAQLAAQTEQLRSALLSSVSHDLRTPLASIIGSVSSLLEYRPLLKQEDQHDLLQTVLEESQRLNRYIQNLLDMTRFGHQDVELRREWVDLNDLVSAAIERFGRASSQYRIEVDIERDVALICVQGALIEQALVNILDNALDFSTPGDTIRISGSFRAEATVIDIVDRGPGIPETERQKVFDMFYTAGQRGDRRHGVGLGLAICRSIVEAHGGTIEALPGPDGTGTRMRISLPLSENPIGDGDA
jgi:two-component system sensor histidine kinase KdpD